MTDSENAAGFMSWGEPAAKLLRTARLEASRSGSDQVTPPHLLLAALDQPAVHEAFRAWGQLPDIYAMRARVAGSSLAPGEFSENLPLSETGASVLTGIRPPGRDEVPDMVYLFVLKQVVADRQCRTLLRLGGIRIDLIEAALDRLD